jgi:hypothetical protein
MPILFKILRDGRDYSCSADGGARFFVGRRVAYEENVGLYNIFSGSRLPRLPYQSADYQASLGFWAHFIEPTAICEGRNFLTLNTYDRAAFTFGFGQFAAHVPNGDFVDYFRTLLTLPNASDYFPNLALVDGRIVRRDGNRVTPLESDDTTRPLMAYLNPDLGDVQDDEVIAAAKLIHWTTNTPAARQAQVDQMVATFRSFMKRADARIGIDGLPADQACVIADILHHGRGGRMTWPSIAEALRSSNPFNNLIAIGAPQWDERKRTLARAIRADAAFQTKRWSRADSDFH